MKKLWKPLATGAGVVIICVASTFTKGDVGKFEFVTICKRVEGSVVAGDGRSFNVANPILYQQLTPNTSFEIRHVISSAGSFFGIDSTIVAATPNFDHPSICP